VTLTTYLTVGVDLGVSQRGEAASGYRLSMDPDPSRRNFRVCVQTGIHNVVHGFAEVDYNDSLHGFRTEMPKSDMVGANSPQKLIFPARLDAIHHKAPQRAAHSLQGTARKQ
jgi:hypothetical protein